MSLFSVEFSELYARHLCRHSQFGINVAHLAAVFGTWFALYGIVYGLGAGPWGLAALAAGYLVVIAFHVPFRVLAATVVVVGLLLAAICALPELPLWAYVLMIPVWYKVQAWSHKIWNVERDMTEFNAKYRKGRLLFVVLLIYDLPILLNYLVYDEKSRA